ncbi:MAG: potassium-transporting ATPase subunit B, partial [Anaerorhabdus sp.]
MKDKKSFITKPMMKIAIKGSFKKLNPKDMIKNPVMFIAYLGMIFTAILTIYPQLVGEDNRVYNAIVTIILFATI